MTEIRKNIEHIRQTIDSCARKYNRNGEDIHLVAISKKQPVERIEAALAAGHRLYGENRVQEAYERWQHRRADFPDLKLHLVGPLQSNKAAEAVALFDCIETVDREKIARILGKEMKKQNRIRPCFIQVNTGEEPQKAGIAPDEIEAFKDYCIQDCRLKITGLMCIPPLKEPPALHFALLKQWAERLDLPHLSMGMSSDYENAIPLGATHIRVGTALFGERPYT